MWQSWRSRLCVDGLKLMSACVCVIEFLFWSWIRKSDRDPAVKDACYGNERWLSSSHFVPCHCTHNTSTHPYLPTPSLSVTQKNTHIFTVCFLHAHSTTPASINTHFLTMSNFLCLPSAFGRVSSAVFRISMSHFDGCYDLSQWLFFFFLQFSTFDFIVFLLL